MAGEEWARLVLEKELKREDVIVNDDGSAPGMYDLRIGPADAPEMAIECVGAVDSTFTETWNVGPAQEPLQLAITGDWRIGITKKANINKIRQHIEHVLQDLEVRGIREVRVNYPLNWCDEELLDELELLGITHANCFRLQGTGKVHLEMSGIGGAVDTRGATVPEWVGEFLLSPRQRDVLEKLGKSGAPERHVFILVTFHGAPWPVESYLSGNIGHLPLTEPNLPFPVTGVWIAYQFGTQGIRWDSAGWRLFHTREETSSTQTP